MGGLGVFFFSGGGGGFFFLVWGGGGCRGAGVKKPENSWIDNQLR